MPPKKRPKPKPAERFSELMNELVDEHLSDIKPETFALTIIKEGNVHKFDLCPLHEAGTKSSQEPKGRGRRMRNLLRKPGVYFIFAHYMEMSPIPLYVGKASDIKTRLSGEHGFGEKFLDSRLELSLSLTVVYTKYDIGLALYLEGLFLQLFDFAFNQKDNDSYRIEEMQKRMTHL